VYNNSALQTISAPNLVSQVDDSSGGTVCSGSTTYWSAGISLQNNPVLQQFEVANLSTIEYLILIENNLQHLNLPNINEALIIRLQNNSALEELSLPNLSSVDDSLFISESARHWDGVDPYGVQRPVHIPKLGPVHENDSYVPGGWFLAGGDNKAKYSLSRKSVWVDDFIIDKSPVTFRNYLFFLNDLLSQGHE
jgi:hypothetical protein